MQRIEHNLKTGEDVIKVELPNGLKVFVVRKPGVTKKIGMYGTVYGSIDDDFIDITTKQRTKVVPGIAHFLEHKLFEQEGDNALDVFAKMGVSSNAYTSFDHTVYYFETTNKFDECVDKLLDFVNTPYFTDENVEKEKGIIAQEIKMYEDEPNAVVYYNVLRAMYKKFPLNIDIAGTVESIYKINKEALYSCYNTFYNPKNMYVIIIGDIDVENTIKRIKDAFETRYHKQSEEVTRYVVDEPKDIMTKEITKKLDVYMPYVCIGFKHEKQPGITNVKNTVLVDMLNDICFSTMSNFYEKLYKDKIITEPINISYESGKDFAHTIIFATSKDYDKCIDEIKKYILKLKKEGIDEELFEIIKKKKQGELIFETEDIMSIHKDIIDSVIQNTPVYESQNILDKVTKEDIEKFIIENLNEDNMVISKVIEK